MRINWSRIVPLIKLSSFPLITVMIGFYLIPSIILGNGEALEPTQAGVWGAFLSVITNKMFYTVIASWFVAQGSKVVIFVIKNRRMDFRLFVGTGGMPSSHVAFVTSIAAVIGFETGWTSPTFMMMLGLSVIIITDAVGMRRAAGRTAAALNRIVDDIYKTGEVKEERLKELLGHTPVEAIVGGIIGVSTAIITYAR